MNRIKKTAKILLGVPLTIIAFVFIGKIFLDSWPKIQQHLNSADPTLIFIGIIFMMGFFLVRSFAWLKMLNLFAKDERETTEGVYLYSLAETKRYIPGNIFSFVSRVQKFHGDTHSKGTVLKAIVLESLVMVISALLVSSPAIINIAKRENLSSFLMVPVAAILVVLMLLLIYRKKIGTIYNQKLKNLFPSKSLFDYINIIFISALAWSFFGIANFLISASIFPTDPNLVIIFSSIFVLSWLVGYVSFIAPMGLGVREASAIYLLSPFLPVYMATAISIFTRIFLIISEIIFLALSFAAYKYRNKIKKYIKSPSLIIVAIAGFSYISYFIYFTILRHYNFFSGKFDLGNMENTLWNTVNGRFFVFSNPDGANELSRLSAHSDFFLLLLAPFYALFPNVSVLMVAQTLVIGLGGFFVYLIAQKIINSPRLAVILAIGYYLNYFVQEQNIFDFHAVSLATSFLLGAFYFLLSNRLRLFSLFLLLAVITKENVFLVSAVFGGYLYVTGRKRFGSAVFIASLLIFIFLMSVAIPTARGGNDHFALDYLAYLGNSPIEILFSPILKPMLFFTRVFSIESFYYLYQNFLPVGFLSFFSPLYAIFLLPDFLINVLSDNPNLRSIQYHYGALIVPFVYISAIYGIKKILSLHKNKSLVINFVFYYLLIFIIYSTFQFTPVPGTKNSDIAPFVNIENKKEIYSSLSQIPDDASVSATNGIGAHLVQRERIYVIPNGIDFVDYLVFYKDEMDMANEIMAYDDEFVRVENTSRIENLIILKRVSLPEISGRP